MQKKRHLWPITDLPNVSGGGEGPFQCLLTLERPSAELSLSTAKMTGGGVLRLRSRVSSEVYQESRVMVIYGDRVSVQVLMRHG